MFKTKHIGSLDHVDNILSLLGFKTLDLFIDNIIPKSIKANTTIDTPKAITEQKMLERLSKLSKSRTILFSFRGFCSHAIRTETLQIKF